MKKIQVKGMSKSVGGKNWQGLLSSDEAKVEVAGIHPAKAAFGVQEWASHSMNFQTGCSRNCRYCYAKSMAIRFKRATAESWVQQIIDLKKVNKRQRKMDGRIMFPTTHDITGANIEESLVVLRNMLDAGNEVLIVSKPSPVCIQKICDAFADKKSQILFRFSIGSTNNKTIKYWEPNAPSFGARLAALRYAFEQGFSTSVSCEPMLDKNIWKVVDKVLPYVTDAVWLGRVNKLRQNISLNCPGDLEAKNAANRLLAKQTDEWLRELYQRYCGNPKVKFKDSIKQAIGLKRPMKAGLDV